MKLNLKITAGNDRLLNFPIHPSNHFLMAEKEVKPVSDPQEGQVGLKRTLAWQVAPNLSVSFKYAIAGVRYTFVTQRNFRIHTFMALLALGLGAFLQISAQEMAEIAITCALVMLVELLNTAIESIVDLTVKQSYHELAKIAKDCAAGAVLIAAMASLLVASLILLPPLVKLLFSV